MGLFAPWFLAGVLAVGLPLWMHLLRQHRSTPRPFASLMFFERRLRSSVKHRRLKYYVLLALRVAMIVLLALLFANPFLTRKADAVGGRGLTLIAIDRSFSMRYGDHMEKARQQALAAVPAGGKAQVVGLSNRVDLLTDQTSDRAALTNAVKSVVPGDAASSYGEFARFLRGLPHSAGAPVEAHLFSDMQKSSLPPSFADLALADNVRLVLHNVATAKEPNWTVETVSAPARLFTSKKGRVQATIAGFATPAARRNVSMVINGKVVESKAVEVPENGRAKVEFTNLDVNYGGNRGEVRIDSADSLPADDRLYFSVERADPARILFVRDGRQSDLYFRAAIESSADAGFDVETVAPDQAANLPLDKYAYVTVMGGGAMPETLNSRLRDYVSAGRGLLVVLGPGAAATGRVPVTGDRIKGSHYSAREGERFQTATDEDHSHPAMQRTDFSGVRFYQTFDVDPAGGRVLARLSDRTPLVIDRKVGEGRVIILASGLDNVSNDLPLHATFVPFVEQVSWYLEGGEERPSMQTVGSFAELRTAGDRGAAAEILDPDGKRVLSLKEAATAKTYQFDREGFYDIRPANGRRELVAVNADRRESNLEMIPGETLALWQGTASSGQGSAGGATDSEEVRQSLWKYLLAALLGIVVAESILANRFASAADDDKREVRKQAA